MLELLTPTEMQAADRLAIAAGLSGGALMERAGAAVAAEAKRLWRGGPIAILAGPGMNGGDGFVAARLLRDGGHRVTVLLHGQRVALRGDAAAAAARFTGVVTPAEPRSFGGAGLVVDALYGAGLRLPLTPAAAALCQAVNRSGAVVLAVDLPSGVEGEGGSADPDAIRATATVTFFRRKPGHLLMPGRRHCGDVTVADIGIPASVLAAVAPRILHNQPSLWRSFLPVPAADGHKYRRGHAVVVSGDEAATGAARLAAEGALRIGAGLVTVASPPSALAINAAHLTAVMVRGFKGVDGLAEFLADRRRNAIVIGPGLGAGKRAARLVETALDGDRAIVLDADALTSFAEDTSRLVAAIAARERPVIMTPHDGELARLAPDLAGSRLHRARAAAERFRAIVILKGPDTVVAAPDGRAAIADNAPPSLATAGSGDVLAGLVGGLLAQGMPAFEAAAAAVWLHGAAATAIGPALIAEDIAATAAAIRWDPDLAAA